MDRSDDAFVSFHFVSTVAESPVVRPIEIPPLVAARFDRLRSIA